MSNYKPNDVPTWADNGERVEPPAEKKDQGFVPRERAHAQYFNWIFNRIGAWLQWLDELFPRPLSTVSGRRYLSMGGHSQTPGLELRGGSGAGPIGEMQWSGTEIEGDDKRVVSMSADTADGSGRLDIHVRNDSEEPLGDPRASLDAQGLHLQKAIDVGGMVRLNCHHDIGVGIDYPAGSRVFDATGLSWARVIIDENDAVLDAITGGTPGQMLFVEFVRQGTASFDTVTLRRHVLDYGAYDFLRLDSDMVLENNSSLSKVCLFIRCLYFWIVIPPV